MKKAAMPIPYIIALILGVIVVAVLAYWFISSGGKGTKIGIEAECKARLLDVCITGDAAKGKAQEVCGTDFNKLCDVCKVIPNHDKTKSGCT